MSTSGQVKMGTKGLPRSCEITMNDFKSCLEDGKRFTVTDHMLTRKNNAMSRVKMRKKGLNRVFYKFRVESDGVTCKPLQIDGKIL